jgi:hypothetical protein
MALANLHRQHALTLHQRIRSSDTVPAILPGALEALAHVRHTLL